ncbi:MAG: thioredoxin family protein [Fusobacterium sp.]|nr:thioredoxin family protein [Fusobacterium sp.]
MTKIQILGTGCSKCQELTKNACLAIDGLDGYEVEKITDITKIMEMGVMMTPALVIGDKVVSSGKILSADEIKKLL